jgi:hypothetical protein
MDPTSREVSPSHLLLHRLAELRQLNENEKPQLLVYRNSSELKVDDSSKSYLESWTSREDWTNWISWQQSGLTALPTLLARSIKDLKHEFSISNNSQYLEETLTELKLATEGLKKVEHFPSLNPIEQRIVHEAIDEIAKFRFKLEKRINNNELIKLEHTYEPPRGLLYYIPKKLTSLTETALQTRKREAFEIMPKLSAFLKSESISLETLESVEYFLNQEEGKELKKYLQFTLVQKPQALNLKDDLIRQISQIVSLNDFSENILQKIKLDVLSVVEKLSYKAYAKNPDIKTSFLKVYEFAGNNFSIDSADIRTLNLIFTESDLKIPFDIFIQKALNNGKITQDSIIRGDLAKSDDLEIFFEQLNLITDHRDIAMTKREAVADFKAFCNSIAKMAIPHKPTETTILLEKLQNFVDPNFKFSERMYDVTLQNISKSQYEYTNLKQFIEGFEDALKVQIPESNSIQKELGEWYSGQFTKYWPNADKQYLLDVVRGNTLVRDDKYLNIHDLRGIPEELRKGKDNKELEDAKNQMVKQGLNAINEICQPGNQKNKAFISFIQNAASQTSLNVLLSGPIGMLGGAGQQFLWSDNQYSYNWKADFPEGNFPPVKITIIRDNANDIEKIHVETVTTLNIVESNSTNKSKEPKIVVKNAVETFLSYNVASGINGEPIVSDFICQYKTHLKA